MELVVTLFFLNPLNQFLFISTLVTFFALIKVKVCSQNFIFFLLFFSAREYFFIVFFFNVGLCEVIIIMSLF